MGFIFGAGTPYETPQELDRQRMLAEALLARGQTGVAPDMWSGLAQLGQALAGRIKLSGVKAKEAKMAEGARSLFGGLAPKQITTPKMDTRNLAQPAGDKELPKRIATDLVSKLGMSPAAAAGVVGNLSHETGGFKHMQELNPTVKGSRGGYGWAQWTGPRRKAFESFAAQKGLDPNSYEANFGFLAHELTQTPENRVMASLQGAKDAGTAAQIFSQQFLRPGVPHMGSRVSRANQISEMLGDGGLKTLPYVPGSRNTEVMAEPQQMPAGADPGNPNTWVDPNSPNFLQNMGGGNAGQQPVITPVNAPPEQPMEQPMPVPQQASLVQALLPQFAGEVLAKRPQNDVLLKSLSRKEQVNLGGVPGGSLVSALMGGRTQQQDPAAPAMQPAQLGGGQAPMQAQPAMQEQPQDRLGQLWNAINDQRFGFLPEMQQKLVIDQYEQELARQNPDPAAALELEKSQLELEALKNPKPETRDVNGNIVQIGADGTAKVIYQSPKEDTNFRTLSQQEASVMGLGPGVWQMGPKGELKRAYAPDPTDPVKPTATMQEYEADMAILRKRGVAEDKLPTIAEWENSKKGAGTSLSVGPDGEITFSQGGVGKPFTEGQSKDIVFSTRAKGALETLDQYDTALTSLYDKAKGAVPGIGNALVSKEYQQAEQAGLEFLQAILRKDTGAAITNEEQIQYGRTYLPQYGDGPEVLAQKKASRARAVKAIEAGMRPDAILAQERALRSGQTPVQQPVQQQNVAPVDQSSGGEVWSIDANGNPVRVK